MVVTGRQGLLVHSSIRNFKSCLMVMEIEPRTRRKDKVTLALACLGLIAGFFQKSLDLFVDTFFTFKSALLGTNFQAILASLMSPNYF